MKRQDKLAYSGSRRVKPWIFITILLFNLLIFTSIGVFYSLSIKKNHQNLYNENINNVNNLNAASAHSAYTYISDMNTKIEDTVNYINKNNLGVNNAVKFLRESNSSLDRQFQLVLCGTYHKNGDISFGNYSGISIRNVGNDINKETAISYNVGYYDILRSFTDINDSNNSKMCFTSEFTDPDTKLKCFAVYRHINLYDDSNIKRLYTLLLVINSKNAMNNFNMKTKYIGQSSVLINDDGAYIVKNSDYRNANFFDYIVNYNNLSLDWKEKLKTRVFKELKTNSDSNKFIDFFYKNHQGDDSVFSITKINNGWYSVTCVPISSFNLEDVELNYSLIILLLFLILFVIDGIAVYIVGNILNYNISVAENAMETATKANFAKSRFLSTMSHELRTPLNAIIGFASLSKDSINDPPQLSDYLKKIEISSRLLLQLISDILDISAIESSKMKITSSSFDVAKLITALSAIYYDQCSKKNIDFNVTLKNIHSEMLIGDSVRLNQILLNFLSNSVKFTPNGGKINLKVEIVERKDDIVTIHFEVSDTGCGISSEQKARLFMPFERAIGDNALKYSGTGLGLSISKSITELMGGKIGMESQEGCGSTFWAEIPFTALAKPVSPSYSPIKGLHIVAAVNNSDEREFISQILTNLCVIHSLADNAYNAIKLLNEEKATENAFNLCILDWKMSDINALDAVKKIRADFSKEELKIMILSYDLEETRQLCLDAGADFIFCKPVFSSSLYNILEEITTNQVRNIPKNINIYNLNSKRVLLAEDNKLNIEVAQKILTKFNLVVETAKNGKECYEKFFESKPGYFDIILMDIQMPIMNGYEATKKIRKSTHRDAKKIPILAMTADAFSEDVDKVIKSGMNEHISKPIEPDTLYSVLQKYLSNG